MILRGLPGVEGQAEGPCLLLPEPERALVREHDRLEQAQRSVRAALDHEAAGSSPVGGALTQAYALMVDDPLLGGRAHTLISAGLSAEEALDRTLQELHARFHETEDSSLIARIADVRQVTARLRRALPPVPRPPRPVLVARDLSPQALLRHQPIAALCLDGGSPLGHTVILARHLGLPTVVGLGGLSERLRGGERLRVDGATGQVEVNPTRPATAHAPSGRLPPPPAGLRLLVDLSHPDEADSAAALDVDGVGLFRTERLVDAQGAPLPEDVQAAHYAHVVRAFAPRPVAIRTYDLHEAPMGLRGVRWLQARPQALQTQLRAICRAGDPVRVLAPMLTDAAELRAFRAAVERAWREVGRPGAMPMVGAMIETPAAALMADEIASVADFMVIGTHDLLQLVAGADREDARLLPWAQAARPALERLLAGVAQATRGRPTWICGALVSKPEDICIMAELGLRAFSLPPARVPQIRRWLDTDP